MFVLLFLTRLLYVLKGCNKVSMVPSLLQTEQTHLPQPFLTGEVFLPPTNFMALLWMQHSRWDCTRAEGQNHLPQPDGHAAFDGAQGAVGFLGCKCTVLAHVQHFFILLSILSPINFFLTLSDLAQSIKALKKLALENLLALHRNERVFTDKGTAESVKHHKTPVKLHFLTEEKKKLLYILFLTLIEILVFL